MGTSDEERGLPSTTVTNTRLRLQIDDELEHRSQHPTTHENESDTQLEHQPRTADELWNRLREQTSQQVNQHAFTSSNAFMDIVLERRREKEALQHQVECFRCFCPHKWLMVAVQCAINTSACLTFVMFVICIIFIAQIENPPSLPQAAFVAIGLIVGTWFSCLCCIGILYCVDDIGNRMEEQTDDHD